MMYQKKKKGIGNKKKIEILILVFVALWGIMLLVNYYRYTFNQPPILCLKSVRKYSDGDITEYTCIGYVYRDYARMAISQTTFDPFWVKRIEIEDKNGLPVPITDYKEPEEKNNTHEDKWYGLLYFFSERYQQLGTYKCINSDSDCFQAIAGHDNYNLEYNDPLTRSYESHKMEYPFDSYAFINDSTDNSGVNNKIYLFDIKNREYLAQYSDIKESYYDKTAKLGRGDNNRYIVKNMEDSPKWGVIEINEGGNVETVLPFEYDSISYFKDSDLYALCKDDIWFIYDLGKKAIVADNISEPIYDVFENYNETVYYKTGVKRTVGDQIYYSYKLYHLNGSLYLGLDNITEIVNYDNYFMFVNKDDSKLHFMNYARVEPMEPIQLYFTDLNYDEYTQPSFRIKSVTSKQLTLRIAKCKELTCGTQDEYIDTKNWLN